MTIFLSTVYKAWTWFSLKTRVAFILILIAISAFGYFYWQKVAEKAEAEKQLEQWLEGQAEKDRQRIDAQKEEVKKAESESNSVRNANYSNMNNDELRNRIIEGVKKIK